MRLSERTWPAIQCDLDHVAVEPDGLHDDTNGRARMIPEFLMNSLSDLTLRCSAQAMSCSVPPC
jgi:hypothetical protein